MTERTAKPEEVRKQVSEDYARHVTKPKGGGCCSPDPKGVVAKIAGYTPTQLSKLPSDAVTNSFGCGNPVAFAEVKPGQTVLDLGSGAGIDLLLASEKVGPEGKVIGVDMTSAMIEKANQNVRSAGVKNVEVRLGIIEKLPVENQSVDWVISNCVINLSPEKPKVFAEIARVLRPGGRISISDIVAEDLPEEVRTNRAMYSSCLSGAVPEKEYLQGLRDAGLGDVKVTDRLLYDRTQIDAFFGVDGEQLAGKSCCGGGSPGGDSKALSEKLAGKVWTVRVSATKS